MHRVYRIFENTGTITNTMTTAERYQAVSSTLFEQGQVELDAGDLVQASEKFWGAAAQALKAIAQERGWDHSSHAHFFSIVRNLVDETGDHHLVELFNAANMLHINFYEHWLEDIEIRTLVDQVRLLLNRLDNIDGAPTASTTGQL